METGQREYLKTTDLEIEIYIQFTKKTKQHKTTTKKTFVN